MKAERAFIFDIISGLEEGSLKLLTNIEMDEGSWSLLALYAVLVLVGGIVGGALPLMLKNLINSDKIINLISIFGAGIMLGVGLIVIVPEGTSLVYGSFP